MLLGSLKKRSIENPTVHQKKLSTYSEPSLMLRLIQLMTETLDNSRKIVFFQKQVFAFRYHVHRNLIKTNQAWYYLGIIPLSNCDGKNPTMLSLSYEHGHPNELLSSLGLPLSSYCQNVRKLLLYQTMRHTCFLGTSVFFPRSNWRTFT